MAIGTTFYISRDGGIPTQFAEERGYPSGTFNVLEVQFKCVDESDWYRPNTPGIGKGEIMAWFTCTLDGDEFDIHTNALEDAAYTYEECKATLYSKYFYEVKTKEDKENYSFYKDKFPAIFI